MFGVKIVVLTKFSPGLYLGFFMALGGGRGDFGEFIEFFKGYLQYSCLLLGSFWIVSKDSILITRGLFGCLR